MQRIIFDIGNVLVDVKLEKFIECVDILISHWTYQPKYSAFTFLEKLQPLQDVGITNLQKALLDYLPQNYDYEELLEAWHSTVSINPKMLSFVRSSINSKGIIVALLSNIGEDHAKWWRAPRLPEFQNSIEHFSCEVGARKPSKLYFQSFLQEYPEFKNALYLDDRPENLAVGAQFGLRPYHFELDKFNTLSEVEQNQELDKIKNAI